MANSVGLLGALLVLACLLGLPGTNNWNLRIPLYLLVFTWSLIRPRVTLYLLPIAIPWGSLDTIGSISSSDILVALLALSWLLSFILCRTLPLYARLHSPLDYDQRNLPVVLTLSLLALLLTMLLSLVGTLSLSSSAKELIKWGELLVIFLLGFRYIRTRQQIWTLVILLCLAAISQAILGYAQAFFNLGPLSFVRNASLRVYGTFNQPNPYAGYINTTLVLAIALLLMGRGWKTRILAACVVVPLLGVEYLSQSKGGWIALLAALILLLAVGLTRVRLALRLAGIAFLVLIGIYLAGAIPAQPVNALLAKAGLTDISFSAPTNTSFANSERVAHWVAGILMFLDHPLFGVGIGNYASAYAPYAQGIFVNSLGHAHNYYINIAAETGIFGLIAFLLFLIALFVSASRSLSRLSSRLHQEQHMLQQFRGNMTLRETTARLRRVGILVNDRALAVGLLAALLSVCVHNLVDNLYVHAMTILFALLAVLLLRLDNVMTSTQ